MAHTDNTTDIKERARMGINWLTSADVLESSRDCCSAKEIIPEITKKTEKNSFCFFVISGSEFLEFLVRGVAGESPGIQNIVFSHVKWLSGERSPGSRRGVQKSWARNTKNHKITKKSKNIQKHFRYFWNIWFWISECATEANTSALVKIC